jgi:hypothetical protein
MRTDGGARFTSYAIALDAVLRASTAIAGSGSAPLVAICIKFNSIA